MAKQTTKATPKAVQANSPEEDAAIAAIPAYGTPGTSTYSVVATNPAAPNAFKTPIKIKLCPDAPEAVRRFLVVKGADSVRAASLNCVATLLS